MKDFSDSTNWMNSPNFKTKIGKTRSCFRNDLNQFFTNTFRLSQEHPEQRGGSHFTNPQIHLRDMVSRQFPYAALDWIELAFHDKQIWQK